MLSINRFTLLTLQKRTLISFIPKSNKPFISPFTLGPDSFWTKYKSLPQKSQIQIGALTATCLISIPIIFKNNFTLTLLGWYLQRSYLYSLIHREWWYSQPQNKILLTANKWFDRAIGVQKLAGCRITDWSDAVPVKGGREIMIGYSHYLDWTRSSELNLKIMPNGAALMAWTDEEGTQVFESNLSTSQDFEDAEFKEIDDE